MENNGTLALVLCITFIGVIGINGLIIMWARRKEPLSEYKVFQRLYKSARNPLKPADDELAELSRLVSNLKKNASEHQTNDQENHG